MTERAVEYSFVFRCLAKSNAKTALDVGTGKTVLPILIANCGIPCLSIDGDSSIINKNRFIKPLHCDITRPNLKTKVDFITCISVLEHIPNYLKAVENMVMFLEIGGTLVMSFPYNSTEFIQNAYDLKDAGYRNSYICRQYNAKTVELFASKFNLEVIDYERWQIFTGKYWTQGKRLLVPVKSEGEALHHLLCVAYRKIK